MHPIWDALGDETWRMYVDLDSQEHGPLAYDRGLGKGQKEPGYLASMARAHTVARASLGARLDLALFEELHRASLAHAPPAETFRPAYAWVGVHPDRMEEGIEAIWAAHDVVVDPREDGRMRIRFGKCAPDEMRARLEGALDTLYRSIDEARSQRDRILAIATFHQHLELWHPTKDGNTRRHTLVLDKLLVDHGETPAIMTEINDAYVRLPASWARMIAQGMNRWRVVRDAIAHGEDVEERMQAFDDEGAIGRRGARWLRANRTSFAPGDWEHVSFVGDRVGSADAAVGDADAAARE